jgi:putative nucleotidyltransferase with HDIG domain
VIADQKSSVDNIVEALKLDPVICGKVLKLSNSAYVGIPRTISSIKNAVVLLGQKRVHSLVLASTVLTIFKRPGELPFPLHNYWKHSTIVAMIAESVARHLRRYGAIETEEVFSAGLLHDIGRMVLGCYYAPKIDAALQEARKKKIPVFEAEAPGLSHTGAGMMLAGHWNFPPQLSDAISYHHQPGRAGDNRRIAGIVHLADVMAHIIGANTFDGESVPKPDNDAVAEVRLPPERLNVIAEDALKNEKKLESFINFLT